MVRGDRAFLMYLDPLSVPGADPELPAEEPWKREHHELRGCEAILYLG